MRTLSYFSVAVMLVFCGASAWATTYGDDVTLNDNIDHSTTAWYGGPGNVDPRVDILGDATHEDNETASPPNTVTGQVWDLEAMYFDSTTDILTLAGGYNFQTGFVYNGGLIAPGDIFLAVNPTLGSGVGQIEAPNSNGSDYNYVIDITGNTYQVYAITGLTTSTGLDPVTDVSSSNPWRYSYGGTAVAGASGTVTYTSYSDTGGAWATQLAAGAGEYTPVGGTHYVMTGFDLSWLFATLGADDFVYAHYTYSCGNDLLTGYIPVPLPGAALLGLIGAVGVIAKRRLSKGVVAA